MPITIPLGDLVRATAVLEQLASQKLTGCARLVYHLARLTKLASVEVAHFREQEQGYIRELGAERDPTPAEQAAGAVKMISVTAENQAKFQQRMAELAAVPVEIAWAPLGLDALETLTIAAQDVMALGPLIVLTDADRALLDATP